MADALRPDAADAVAGGSAGRAPSRERARRLRAGGGRWRSKGMTIVARGRREHDGRDAECVRAGRCSTRGARGGPRAYGRASRGATAVRTSAATASFARSPSSRSQPSRRGLTAVALAHARQQREVALVLVAVRRSCVRPRSPARCRAGCVRSGGGRKRWISREPRGVEALRLAVGDARREVAIADDRPSPAAEHLLDVAASSRSGSRRRAAA